MGVLSGAPQMWLGSENYDVVYSDFVRIAALPQLDAQVKSNPALVGGLEVAVDAALEVAYSGFQDDPSHDAAHCFLQRILYGINRLKLFWYDGLENYENERSNYLRALRDRIEDPWQAREQRQHDVAILQSEETGAALTRRAAADLAPPVSANGRYFRENVSQAGYRKLLEIASLDGLVEASQLSRTLGGVGNEVHSVLTRLLLEEYGLGRLQRKHSSYFALMLSELGMDTTPEAYFESVPWQVLAAINHSFLLSERKRYFLRYIGGLLYTEISVPAAFSSYAVAARRLGLADNAHAYWDLHIKEDERHGRWMLDDIALPLARRYPEHAWELVLGYDQQRLFSERSGAAIANAARAADPAVPSTPRHAICAAA